MILERKYVSRGLHTFVLWNIFTFFHWSYIKPCIYVIEATSGKWFCLLHSPMDYISKRRMSTKLIQQIRLQRGIFQNWYKVITLHILFFKMSSLHYLHIHTVAISKLFPTFLPYYYRSLFRHYYSTFKLTSKIFSHLWLLTFYCV